MRYKRKQIIIVGDRVLIQPDTDEKKSAAGLYLPPSVIEKQDVHGGIVVEVGPGIPVGNPDDSSEEPWKINSNGDIRYIINFLEDLYIYIQIKKKNDNTFITISTDSWLTIYGHFQPFLRLLRISSRIQKTRRL